MSNVLKSKVLLGAMIVLAVFVGAMFIATTANAYTHSTTLKMGMSNSQVMELQKTLNSNGFIVASVGAGSPGMETMYFGQLTKNAVMAFQSSKGLSMVDGIVGHQTGTALAAMTGGSVVHPAGCTSSSGFSTTTGASCSSSSNLPAGCTSTSGFSPVTGAACNSGSTLPAGCTSTSGFSPTTGMSCSGGGSPSGPLAGGAGDITVTGTSTNSSEDVGEDEEDVPVMSFEVEADDNSDVDITSVKVEFFQGTAADSSDLDDYAESVSVWMGSDKVGEADVSDFSENSDVWSKSISLSDAVVRAGDTEEFSVAVTALNNLDSGDIDDDAWYGGVSSVRFEDADGVVTTTSLTLDVDEEVVDDEVEQTFDFDSFATASDVELKVHLNDDDDDINEAHVINVDDTDDTEDEPILSFTLEAQGSDINVDEIPVLFTSTETTGNDPDDLLSKATLWHNGEEIASESFLTTDANDSVETITFEDLDLDISEGDTEEFMVKVDLQSTGDTLDDGDTVMADLTATEVDAISAEDESGEDLAAGDLTGTADGEASEVRDIGIMVSLVSTDAEVTSTSDGTAGVSDSGTFTLTFDVTSFDGDAFVDLTAPDASGGATESDLDATGTGTLTAVIDCAACTEGTNGFQVDEDATERFTITTNILATASGFFDVELTDLLYALTDVDGDTQYTFNLDEFKTDQIFLRDF